MKLVVAITVFLHLTCVFATADELVLDESMTEFLKVGDFDVSACNAPVVTDQTGCFNERGEITAGQLYSFFKKQGLESVDVIRLSLDVDPNALRADYALDSIEFSIEDFNSIEDFKYTIGDNSLRLPAYEASDMKPEAQIAIKLDYDFMKKFNERSTEKLKFEYLVNGKKMATPPVKVAAFAERSEFSAPRMLFLTAFAGFWVIVFVVLFRTTNPKTTGQESSNAASPA